MVPKSESEVYIGFIVQEDTFQLTVESPGPV